MKYDINNFHTIDDDKKTESQDPESVDGVFYTIMSNHDYLDAQGNPCITISSSGKEIEKDIFTVAKENHKVYAYSTSYINPDNDTSYRFYLKRGKHGRLFNPVGLYSEGNSTKVLKHAGKPEWSFQSVPEDCFKLYLSFLRTKNEAYLSNAEREVQ